MTTATLLTYLHSTHHHLLTLLTTIYLPYSPPPSYADSVSEQMAAEGVGAAICVVTPPSGSAFAAGVQAEAATPPKGSGTDAGLSSSGVEVEVSDDSLLVRARVGVGQP